MHPSDLPLRARRALSPEERQAGFEADRNRAARRTRYRSPSDYKPTRLDHFDLGRTVGLDDDNDDAWRTTDRVNNLGRER